MKKIILLLSITFFINACSFLNMGSLKDLPIAEVEKKLNEEYADLSNQYFQMLEDPIKERERISLLKKFEKFKNEVVSLRMQRIGSNAKDLEMFNSYINKTNLNIQYLNDLAD